MKDLITSKERLKFKSNDFISAIIYFAMVMIFLIAITQPGVL